MYKQKGYINKIILFINWVIKDRRSWITNSQVLKDIMSFILYKGPKVLEAEGQVLKDSMSFIKTYFLQTRSPFESWEDSHSVAEKTLRAVHTELH